MSTVTGSTFIKSGIDNTVILLGAGDMDQQSTFTLIYMGSGAGASCASVAVYTLENAGFPKYLFYADDIVFAGSAPHVASYKFGTDGKVTITIKTLT
ncbi:MAG: hypothetical protein EZS28_028840 [Streblomastix strix]|uniref:Uncharacterized protein n=1 Tax=Streblomastix strix TaxID=222440 RepID=A0A5J4V0S4_9EUKA|nr:MAG: hypothetical protein EZS28_028840 [Streblomastix strix]